MFWDKQKKETGLVTIAAHKLRTPLTRIKWAVTTLKQNLESIEDRKILNSIELANEQLILIADTLIEAAGGKAEKKLNMGLVDLGEVTKAVLREMSHEFSLKNIQLSNTIPFGVPAIKADREVLEDTIKVLLGNALAYTQSGGHVHAKVESDGNKVTLTIEDSGIGITSHEKSQIFTEFYRSPRAILADTEGLGLSLYITKRNIERQKGEIAFSSAGENKGSKFTIKFSKA